MVVTEPHAQNQALSDFSIANHSVVLVGARWRCEYLKMCDESALDEVSLLVAV